MKKTTLFIFFAFLFLMAAPAYSESGKENVKTEDEKASDEVIKAERVKELQLRIEEIKEIDKSELSSAEKKELRKELRSIKKELREMDSAIYISGGALIIIVLLILLL